MSQDNRARLKEWLETGEARLQPLTLSQRELWETSPVPAADVSNHICTFMEIGSKISPKDCIAAMQRVVDRQEVLRLSILPGKTQPLQLIRSTGTPSIEFHELTPAETKPEALEARLQKIFEKPFDLLRGPLYRVEILRRGPEDLVLVFAIHHAIADGWTLGVFVQDIFASYLHGIMGAGSLPAVPQTYSEWGAAERASWPPEKLEEHARYWKKNLKDAPRIWEAPAQAGPRRLVRKASFLPAEVTNEVRNVMRRSDATLFSTLLTAFQITLFQWTGKSDIVVGTPVANRAKQSVRETMGYCSGNVPIRGLVVPDRPFEQSVREMHQVAMDAFANAMPFAELVKALNDPPTPDHNPIFDVRFALQNHPIPDIDVPGLTVQLRMRSTGTARFDLGCEITEIGDGLEVIWLYRPTLFTDADLETLDRIFLEVLTNASRLQETGTAALSL